MSFAKSCSYLKNVIPLTELPPRPIITWDQEERIRRNKEIWDNPKSIVHKLPRHYQERYWTDFVIAKRTPIHYQPPQFRFYWDKNRNVEIETEEYPILPEHCPEQDQGLWGGEGVIKGYYRSKPKKKKKILPRQWIPRLYFPDLKHALCYSEVLDKYMKIVVTERVCRLIDHHFGLDLYLLETRDVDINSKLGMDLKREILIKLAEQSYYPNDQERHEYIKDKYKKFVMPLEEAEWYGLDLNAACRKLQDIEDNATPRPLKEIYEEQLIAEIQKQILDEIKEQQKSDKKKDDENAETEKDQPLYPRDQWIGWKI